ncbi:twin-arginine translocase subunit TatC [Tautonia plasticadhaerens]|uniref:Sec-independent protein translocase protein TatC n=1 Tax=Tautonia plasticadhaerens TaxID=2527974 RepID=A0A518H081_9BACT|nr:twin-arginine translocase subunit TatC [Tautonia plasticadhaerens]QDV34243.1 Sec-independent protein translocase protein TatCy [Tautonia plasticadhaerens]
MPHDRDLFDEEQEMVAMSFGDHIEELRMRLVLALLGLAVGVILTLVPPINIGFHVMHGMQDPAQRALDEYHAERTREKIAEAVIAATYTQMPARIPAAALLEALREIAPTLELPEEEPSGLEGHYIELPMEVRDAAAIDMVSSNVEQRKALISLRPLETAVIFFTVCLITGLVIASPWVFYHLWAFVAAGLYRHERKYVYRYLPFSLGLFLGGVGLCYFGVLPLTLRFLLQFNIWLDVEPNLQLTAWMGFATLLPLVFGLGFQTPLVMLFVGKLGIVSATDFREKRKFAVLGTVVLAAMLTPGPDVVSQLLLAVPMLLLYELGIVMVARGEAEAAKAEPAD